MVRAGRCGGRDLRKTELSSSLRLKTGGPAGQPTLRHKEWCRVRLMKIAGLCLVALMSVFAFGFAGSASAKVLLLQPEEGAAFPVHFAGTGGKTGLEQDNGQIILAGSVDILGLALDKTLFDTRLTFLNAHNPTLGASCQTPKDPAGTILANFLGHLGLTHPGDLPGVLLLSQAGFSFECLGIAIDVRGSLIASITKPKILEAKQKEFSLSFKQTGGIQEQRSFLLGNELLTGQDLESNVLTTGSKFLLAGLEAEAVLKILTGSFQIVDE